MPLPAALLFDSVPDFCGSVTEEFFLFVELLMGSPSSRLSSLLESTDMKKVHIILQRCKGGQDYHHLGTRKAS